MPKPKRKLTPSQKAEKARRRAEFMFVFLNGKQKRVRRPQLIEGLTPDEFIRRNADPLWLHQNEMWEYITPCQADPAPRDSTPGAIDETPSAAPDDDEDDTLS
jgi:hypothetical protein